MLCTFATWGKAAREASAATLYSTNCWPLVHTNATYWLCQSQFLMLVLRTHRQILRADVAKNDSKAVLDIDVQVWFMVRRALVSRSGGFSRSPVLPSWHVEEVIILVYQGR